MTNNEQSVKFGYKFLIFPSILLLTFISAYLILEYFSRQNDVLLIQAQEIFIPNSLASTEIKHKLFLIQSSLQNSVATGDLEQLNNTDTLATEFRNLCQTMKSLDNYEPADSLLNAFDEYYINAKSTSILLMSNLITENIGSKIDIMLMQYNNLSNLIKDTEEKSRYFSELHFKKINQNNSTASRFNLIIIAAGFAISILVAFSLSRTVIKPFKVLNKALENAVSELNEKNSALEISETALRENVATKDKFFSIMAHDLRSPLGGLMQLSQMMEAEYEELSEEEAIQFVKTINKSAQSVFKLLENLLEWSRMQRGLIPYNPESLNLCKLVNESIANHINTAKAKNIAITLNINNSINVFADEKMINAVIRNFVSNAIKFTPADGNIIIFAERYNDEQITIAIKDSGIGMPAAIKDNIFNIEANTSRPGTEGESSTGLGLIICKDFIDKHSGKIWVESSENIGTTFYFNLPEKNPTETIC